MEEGAKEVAKHGAKHRDNDDTKRDENGRKDAAKQYKERTNASEGALRGMTIQR
jgi:hypothetical protein